MSVCVCIFKYNQAKNNNKKSISKIHLVLVVFYIFFLENIYRNYVETAVMHKQKHEHVVLSNILRKIYV